LLIHGCDNDEVLPPQYSLVYAGGVRTVTDSARLSVVPTGFLAQSAIFRLAYEDILMRTGYPINPSSHLLKSDLWMASV
jgi:hypothetical protein